MKLLLNTHVDNEFFDGCCYAFLDLDPALAQVILNRRDALLAVFNADSSATSIEYYGCEPVFLDGLPGQLDGEYDAESAGLGDGNPFAETQACVEDFENAVARTECKRMVITSDEVYWTCYPKNCDPKAETRPIDYNTVRRAAGIPEVL